MAEEERIKKIVEKRRKRVAESEDYYKDGVEHPTKDWAEEYEKASERMYDAIKKAIAENLFVLGAKRTGTEGWKRRTLEKADRWIGGATSEEANKKYEEAIAEVLDCVEEAKKAVEKLPTRTIEERAEKSKRFQIALHNCMERKKKERLAGRK
ncbi:hypothetical protein DRP04_08390 [Archaeoglobales archaeon]|nr:MAG: hypothetical protein DRP04_08390 [Archaeoglobales archaeon]